MAPEPTFRCATLADACALAVLVDIAGEPAVLPPDFPQSGDWSLLTRPLA